MNLIYNNRLAFLSKVMLLSVALLCFSIAAFSQVAMSGKVLDKNTNQPLAFASISFSFEDEKQYSTLADTEGQYIIENLSTGNARVQIFVPDYVILDTTTLVVFPSVGEYLIKNFFLEKEPENLQAATVSAAASTQDILKKTILITKDDLEYANSGIDLIGKVSQLDYSETEHKLVANNGGNVKILINGASATEVELLAINADQIKSIEYYDLPPSKYYGYSNVVNMITTGVDDGFYSGVSLQHAFSTGFWNDDIFIKFNKNKSQFTLAFTSNYRNYRRDQGVNSYQYAIGEHSYEHTDKYTRQFGYSDNTLNINYTYNNFKDFQFQAKLLPYYNNTHSNANQDIIFRKDEEQQGRNGYTENHIKEIQPALDLFLDMKTGEKGEITAGLLFSGSKSKQNQILNEKTNETCVFSDIMQQENNKYDVLADIHYDRIISGMSTISIGSRTSYDWLKSSVNNSFSDKEYRTTFLTSYNYLESVGKYRHLSWRASVGLYYLGNSGAQGSYKSWTFRPNIVAMYSLSDNFQVRGVYTRSNDVPTLSKLSDTEVFIAENIIKAGNPLLKESTLDMCGLMLGITYPWIDADLLLVGAKEINPINNYYFVDENYVRFVYENGTYSYIHGARTSMRILPLKKELLALKINGLWTNTNISGPSTGNYRYHNFQLEYGLDLKFEHFKLSYQGRLRSWELDGTYLQTVEPQSDLTARYTFNNLTISAGIYWLFTDAKYESRTIETCPILHIHSNSILDNKNMITLGISYRFSKGREYVEKEVNIENKVRDNGLLK